MPPIRVGLIGLSGAPTDEYEGVSWTPNAHLPYLQASSDYEIIALLNSSVGSAERAIEKYKLPPSTKAYGNPEDLAADPDVDLVVCSVRVDRHYLTVKPSIIAGKSIYVEWPLERNLEIAKEMTALAAKHNVKTVVGIQGAFSSVAKKMKETIDSGRIGNVLSSTFFSSEGNGGATEVKNVRYFLDRKIGGELVSIRVGHQIEVLTSVLGEFKSWNSLLSNRHAFKDVVDPAHDNQIVQRQVPNTVPDQMMIQGLMGEAEVPISIHHRGGSPFPGTPTAEWRIQGDDGEIRLTTAYGSMNVGHLDTKIEVCDKKTDKVEVLTPDRDQWDELPVQAHNIARLYEAFRKGEWYPDFAWAVKRHEMIEEIWKQYDGRQK